MKSIVSSTKLITGTLSTIAVFLLAVAAQAGPITWGTPTTIAGDTDVSTLGTLNYAYNVKGTYGAINGVTFTYVNGANLNGDVIISASSGNIGHGTSYGGAAAPFNALSANYQGVLNGGDYATTAGASLIVTLNNLTFGHYYLVQIWADDSRSSAGTKSEVATSSGGNSVTLAYCSTHTTGGVGQYTIGTFSAWGTSQSFTLNSANAQLNLILVRDVTASAPPNAYFNGGSGTIWDASTTADWATASGGPYNQTWSTVGGGSSAPAIFEGTANTVAVSGAVSVGRITFATDGYTLAGGGTLTLGDSLIATGAGTDTISNILAGSAGLTKTGSGILVLAGTNTYTGSTLISGGTLSVNAISDNPLTNSAIGYGTNIVNAVNFTGGTLNFTGTNGFTGRTFNFGTGGGTLNVSSNSTLSLSTATTATTTTNAGWTGTGGVTLTGAGVLTLGNSAVAANRINVDSTIGGGPWNVNMTNGTLNLATGNYFDICDTANGFGSYNQTAGTVNFTGKGGFYFANASGCTATMTVSGGSFLQSSNYIHFGATANSMATLSVGGGAGVATVNVPYIVSDSANSSGVITVLNLITNGTLVTQYLGVGTGVGLTTTLNFDGGTLTASAATNAFVGPMSINVQAGGAIIDDGGYAITIGQPLLNGAAVDGGLTKTSSGATPGTLVLTGVNTYTGNTTISKGTLEIDGSLASGSAVSVAPAGILTGSGTIGGPIMVHGTIEPGTNNTIGTLSCSSSVTLYGTNIMKINQASSDSSDQLSVSGGLVYGGQLYVTNLSGTLTTNDAFGLFNPPGSGAFASIFPANPGAGLAWNTNTLTTDGKLRITVGSAIATNPTNISYTVSGNTLSLSWPGDHLGWYAQSNSVSLLSTNFWFDIPNSQLATNLNITINPSQANVFYRLRSPN